MIFFVTAITQSLAYTVIMFTHEFWVAVTTLFVLGLCCSARAQVGILYMLEFIPLTRMAFVGSTFFLMEVVMALVGVFYFAFISNHWVGYVGMGYVMQLVGTLLCYFLPESPKYLFKKGQSNETSMILRRIATRNGVDPISISEDDIDQSFKAAHPDEEVVMASIN